MIDYVEIRGVGGDAVGRAVLRRRPNIGANGHLCPTDKEEQLGLFGGHLTIQQRFAVWKQLPGAGRIMERAYRMTAGFFKRFQRRKIGVSQRLIEELLRDSMRIGRLKGVNEAGYELNSHFTKPILLHMLQEHPEWRPMFELREKKGKT